MVYHLTGFNTKCQYSMASPDEITELHVSLLLRTESHHARLCYDKHQYEDIHVSYRPLREWVISCAVSVEKTHSATNSCQQALGTSK